MASRYLKYLSLAVVLASVMAFAVACGDDEKETGAAAPAPAATTAPAVVEATVAPAEEKAPAHLKMAQSDDTNTVYCGETDAVPAVMFGKALCDAHIDFIQDELLGRLAISWEANADSTEWVYQLREGVTFHNGKPFDAVASAADLNYKRTSTEPQGGWNFGIYGAQLSNVEATGPFEVTLTMKKPSPIWPLDETWWDGGVSEQSLIDEIGLDAFREDPVGTGPFKFISWERLHKEEMEAGPPLAQRIDSEELRGMAEEAGLRIKMEHKLNGSQYMITMRK